MPGINQTFPTVYEGDRPSARWMNDVARQVSANSRFPRNVGMHTKSIDGRTYTVPEDPPGRFFYNADSQTIPAYGCILITGSHGTAPSFPSCQQPNVFGCQTNVVVNGGSAVAGTDIGEGQHQYDDIIAAYDPADGVPSPGEHWGPRPGTYLLKRSTGGFMVSGVYDSSNNLALVTPEPMYFLYGKVTGGAVGKGGSTTINIYAGNPGFESDTSITQADILARFGAIPANAFVDCRWNQTTYFTGSWVAIQTDQCG